MANPKAFNPLSVGPIDPVNPTLAQYLRQEMVNRGMTRLMEVSTVTGIGPITLRGVMTDSTVPNHQAISRYAKFLHVPLASLERFLADGVPLPPARASTTSTHAEDVSMDQTNEQLAAAREAFEREMFASFLGSIPMTLYNRLQTLAPKQLTVIDGMLAGFLPPPPEAAPAAPEGQASSDPLATARAAYEAELFNNALGVIPTSLYHRLRVLSPAQTESVERVVANFLDSAAAKDGAPAAQAARPSSSRATAKGKRTTASGGKRTTAGRSRPRTSSPHAGLPAAGQTTTPEEQTLRNSRGLTSNGVGRALLTRHLATTVLPSDENLLEAERAAAAQEAAGKPNSPA